MRLRYRIITAIATLAVAFGFAGTTAHAATNHSSGVSSASTVDKGWNGPWKGGDSGRHDNGNHEWRHDGDCCRDHHDHCCDNGGDSSSDCDWWREHDHDRWWRDCEGH